jgi:tRNA pseudouridine38-40 synthase
MRYFVELSYHGASFHGWQKQPNQKTVQTTLEEGLSTILNTPSELVGCGRTDAGVHASLYYGHFDVDAEIPNLDKFAFQWNALIGYDISIMNIFKVADTAHARFDATKRSYTYNIHQYKNPFLKDRSFHFPTMYKIDVEKLQSTASMLLNYEAFFPFCKANTQVHTMECKLMQSEWVIGEGTLAYKISADRFLRGMVRLIVGTCINVAMDKLDPKVVEYALEKQIRFNPAWSVPAQGLFLDRVQYPYL